MSNWDAAFANAWFGPIRVMNVYSRRREEEVAHPGAVYNDGPMDGLIEASMHAQSFGQIPLVNYAQRRPAAGGMLGVTKPVVFCKPGFMPVPTGVPGQSKCVQFSPPSQMFGAGPPGVSALFAPSYPQAQTFPVGPGFAMQNR